MSHRLFFTLLFVLILKGYGTFAQVPAGAVYKCKLTVRLEDSPEQSARLQSEQYYDSSARLIQEIHMGSAHPQLWRKYKHIDTVYSDPSDEPVITFKPWDMYVYQGKNLAASTLHVSEGFVIHTDFVYTADGRVSGKMEKQIENGSVIQQSAHYFTYNNQGRKIREVVIANAADTEVVNNIYYHTLPEKTIKNITASASKKQIDQFITLDSRNNPVKEITFLLGFVAFEKVSVYNEQSQVVSEIITHHGDTISSNYFTYNVQGEVVRKEHTEEVNTRRVFVYNNRLPQLEEYWLKGKLWSTVRYEYEPVTGR